jgi:hypothetical protein
MRGVPPPGPALGDGGQVEVNSRIEHSSHSAQLQGLVVGRFVYCPALCMCNCVTETQGRATAARRTMQPAELALRSIRGRRGNR